MYIFRPENRKDFCGRGSVARQPKKMSMKLFYPEAIQWKYQISSEKKKMIQINLAAEKIVLLSFWMGDNVFFPHRWCVFTSVEMNDNKW